MALAHPPADDEIEVTVFGRGVGECAVVHVGNGRWAIIDSYVCEHKLPNPRTGRSRRVPVAQWYLQRLGVERERVGEIIVTHLHADHYRGVAGLHDHYENAQLLVTAALNDEVIRQVYADQVVPGPFGEMPGTMERAKLRKRTQFQDGLRTLSVEWCRQYASNVFLRALSPIDAAVRASAAAVAEHMTTGRPAVREALRDQNWSSVVLHLDTPAGCALLCADLVNAPDQYGWAAVLAEPSHQHLRPAEFIKVGHHGSHTADHRGMWDKLVIDEPVMAVAPYTSLPDKLPTENDCARLCARGELYQAAPSFDFIANAFGFPSRDEGPTGLIQARRRPEDERWQIRTEGAAFHVNPLLAPSG